MTLAEAVKVVLDVAVGNYPTYEKKPPVRIRGIDSLTTKRPDKGVTLIDIGDTPQFTTNGVRLPGEQKCEMIINETTATRRSNLYDDIETLFQASSYDLTIVDARIDNAGKSRYIIRCRIRYFGGKI